MGLGKELCGMRFGVGREEERGIGVLDCKVLGLVGW